MPAIIDSAPDCVVHKEGYDGDDIADFILQQQLPGLRRLHDVRPGSTYGDEGVGAATAYMTLTWIGIVVMVIVFVGWVWYENRRLTTFAKTAFVPSETWRRRPSPASGILGATTE